MAGVLQHLRSSTLNKRPNPASMVDGQVAINYASGSPGMFFKDSNGSLVKVGPVHVGSGAPNVSPASGGTAGNSLGEQWLDTSGGTYVFKIWDGGAWRSEAGEFVNTTGDTMTGALGIIAGSASTPGLFFSGDANTGLYSPGADQVAISTGGTRRLVILSDGKVGLGAASVLQQGSGVDGGSAAGVLELYNGGTGDTTLENTGAFPILFKTNGSERLRITSAGLVGVGTSSPESALDVRNASISQIIAGLSGGQKAVIGSDTSTGAYVGTLDNYDIKLITNSTAKAVVTSAGNVGIGTTSPRYNLSLGSTALTSTASPDTIDLGGTYSNTAGANLKFRLYWDGTTAQGFGISASQMDYVAASNAAHVFYRGASEVARFDTAGSLIYGTSTSPGADITSGTGFYYQISTGLFYVRSNGSPVAAFNRGGNDGTLVEFKQDQTTEGTISVSGTTVSYNGAHLSRWSQLPSGAERTEILRGSVLSNIDEMCEWGNEDNEQLNRMKVSDVEGDKNVSGVFQAWDDDDDTYINDFYCAMTGDFIIRIAQGVTVERGDLLMSAGDGTAKPQDDDIIRSKTIAKVTSTNVSCTYADGSYCVPCVLMAC